MSSLLSFSQDLAALVGRTAPSVVAVHGRPRFHSSGVIWSPGVVITADHALRQDDEITVTTHNGEQIAAELAGRDPGTDIAVLRLENRTLPAVHQTPSGAHLPGQLALVVGRNKESVHADLGVIASVGGASDTWRGGRLDQVIRLSHSLHPSAAGAAVVDAGGAWIGMATPALSRVSAFAVSKATVDRVTAVLLERGRMPQGYLGVGLQPVPLPEHLIQSLGLSSRHGLMTVSVDENAPAGKAGWFIGDVLVELDGQPVTRLEDLRANLAASVGKTLSARILRGGALVTLDAAVAERPGKG